MGTYSGYCILENISATIVALIAFNLLFFWQAWSNPFSLATSELLSTFFPSWIHQGRGEKNDKYYWLVPNAHPVLSYYYPTNVLSSFSSSAISLDKSFILFVFIMCGHFLFASIGWYSLISSWSIPLVALFGAITLTYSSYNIKQQPCLIYTISWFPWLLLGIANHSILLSSVSFGMILLAGYYPIGIQATLIAVCASVWWDSPLTWLPIGTLIGLPQLISFFRYLPKTIRTNKVSNIGKIKWYHFITLLLPSFNKPKDVGFWETSCYVGIAPLMIIAIGFASSSYISGAWMLGVASYILAMGAFSSRLPRIPARWLWTFQFSIGWVALSSMAQIGLPPITLWCLLLIQCFDLWYHNRLWPTRPYSELPNRPSFAFNTQLTRFLEGCQGRVSGLPWPLFTGHINRIKTLGYSGGMQLKLMAKWRNDTNPDGSGEHDYFRSNTDGEAVDRYRIKYAFSRKKLNGWLETPIKHLYRNPRFSN